MQRSEWKSKREREKKAESQEIYDLSLDKWHDRTTSIWSSLPNGSPITLMDHENEWLERNHGGINRSGSQFYKQESEDQSTWWPSMKREGTNSGVWIREWHLWGNPSGNIRNLEGGTEFLGKCKGQNGQIGNQRTVLSETWTVPPPRGIMWISQWPTAFSLTFMSVF